MTWLLCCLPFQRSNPARAGILKNKRIYWRCWLWRLAEGPFTRSSLTPVTNQAPLITIPTLESTFFLILSFSFIWLLLLGPHSCIKHFGFWCCFAANRAECVGIKIIDVVSWEGAVQISGRSMKNWRETHALWKFRLCESSGDPWAFTRLVFLSSPPTKMSFFALHGTWYTVQ